MAFIKNIRQGEKGKLGERYDSGSLKNLFNGMQRVMRESQWGLDNLFVINLCTDQRFVLLRNTLQEERRISDLTKVKSTEPDWLSIEEEEMINVALSADNPTNLRYKMFIGAGMKGALRGKDEHYSCRASQFKKGFDQATQLHTLRFLVSVAFVLLIYFRFVSVHDKNHKTGTPVRDDILIFEVPGSKNCFYKLVLKYMSHRPYPLKPDGSFDDFPLYLQTNPGWLKGKKWFKKQRIGVNNVSGMMRAICKLAGISSRTNQALRAAAATRIYQKTGSKDKVKSMTGHRSSAVDRYLVASSAQRLELSDAVAGVKRKTPVLEADENESYQKG
jgi:hypothetical protein